MTVEAASAGARTPRWPGRARATDSPLGPPAAYLAELIGTFALVFFICTVLVVNSSDGLGFTVTDFVAVALVHFFVLMMLIHALGAASGAHFNPAVTIALLVLRRIKPPDAVVYIVVQVVGAVLAALLVKLLLKDEGSAINYGATTIAEAPAPPTPAPGQPAPTEPAGTGWLDGKPLGGLAVEVIGTFFLMWAIMAMAVNPKGEKAWAGLVIGATLGLQVLVFAPIDGAGFNPARSFGPAIASGEWADFWVYVVGPVLGAVLAALAYTAVVLTPQERLGQRPIDTYEEADD